MNEIEIIDETQTKKMSTLVLEIDGIKITRDAMSWVVTGSKQGRNAYFPSLESALVEVSNRLFSEKFVER